MANKVLLIVLDGYGEGKDYKYNAVTRSNTPFIDSLRKNYPTTLLRTEGQHVGQPKGAMGGSEVGHFTIGAGRIVWQTQEDINRSIKSKSFFELKYLQKAAQNCRKNNSKLHLICMISDQGIHAHINHLFALLKFAKKEKLQKVYIHAITDGRDVPEKSAKKYIKQLKNAIKKYSVGKIATIIGRYYAMDRDFNYERTQIAYDLYTLGKGQKEKSALQAIDNEYKRGTPTDYYIKPILLDESGLVESKDSVILVNYRTDRAIQLTKAFTEKSFREFKRTKTVLPYYVCFGPYSKIAPVLFPQETIHNNLGETLSKHGLTQLRLSEGEKFAHVTFFLNSQKKEPYKGEKRIMIQSKKCASYDEKPEMSAYEITEKLVQELNKKKKFDFILTNFPNGDVVGHSGNFQAVVKSIETLDKCLAKIIPEAQKNGYNVIVTADHGNSEEMKYRNGEVNPAHSYNPVIFIYISDQGKKITLRKSKTLGLSSVAPTILASLGIPKPKEMTGKTLFK